MHAALHPSAPAESPCIIDDLPYYLYFTGMQEESEDWSAAAVLLLEGCNRLARQEMSKASF
jgi:hypothetical protein